MKTSKVIRSDASSNKEGSVNVIEVLGVQRKFPQNDRDTEKAYCNGWNDCLTTHQALRLHEAQPSREQLIDALRDLVNECDTNDKFAVHDIGEVQALKTASILLSQVKP